MNEGERRVSIDDIDNRHQHRFNIIPAEKSTKGVLPVELPILERDFILVMERRRRYSSFFFANSLSCGGRSRMFNRDIVRFRIGIGLAPCESKMVILTRTQQVHNNEHNS
jgi:hypothetical protein